MVFTRGGGPGGLTPGYYPAAPHGAPEISGSLSVCDSTKLTVRLTGGLVAHL